MGLSFKTAAGLLLLVQFFHLASFQHSTNPPAVTIDRSWLRELVRNGSASLNRALAQNGLEYDERGQSPDKSSGGIASGGMTIYSEEDENLTAEGSGDEGNMLTAVPVDVTVAAFEPPESNMSLASNVTDGASESNRVNITDTTEFPDNPTTPTTTPRNDSSDLSAQNVTSTEDLGNHTDSTTALPPQENVTNETTPTVAKDWNSRIDSASTVSDIPEVTMVEFNKTVDQTDTPVTPTTSLKALTAVEVNTPEGTNKTGKVAAEGSSSDRGMTVRVAFHPIPKSMIYSGITFNWPLPQKQTLQIIFQTSHSILDTFTLAACSLFFFSACLFRPTFTNSPFPTGTVSGPTALL